jgi:hypothetical protein
MAPEKFPVVSSAKHSLTFCAQMNGKFQILFDDNKIFRTQDRM